MNGCLLQRDSIVEATRRSHQHEFNGSAPLKYLLGSTDRRDIPTRFIWLSDQQEAMADDGLTSWYDSRRGKKHRAAEYRLYYKTNSVTELMQPEDTIFLALQRDGSLMIIVAPAGSTVLRQLIWMFGVEEPEFEEFQYHGIDENDARLDFAVRYIFDELGIEPEEPEAAKIDGLIERFGARFPSTKEFSALARRSLRNIKPLDDPDAVLLAWLEREELMFRRLERRIVSSRLEAGFMIGGAADVDSFVKFSLSVQNRRKSRVGYALEHHLALQVHTIVFCNRSLRRAFRQ